MVESVTYRDLKPTPAIKRELLNARLEIEERFPALVSLEWTLESVAGEAVARCRIHSRSGFYRATARTRSLPQSISAALEKLLTQRGRSKAMRIGVRGRARPGRSAKDAESSDSSA